jgi:hypothetical protein
MLPRSIAKLTSSTATNSPKRLVSPRASITADARDPRNGS